MMPIDKGEVTRVLSEVKNTSFERFVAVFKIKPGDTHTLTSRELYRQYDRWCRKMDEVPIRPEPFCHEMKLMGFRKKPKQIRDSRRDVYLMDEEGALMLLARHRHDPTPANYTMAFDVTYYKVMGLGPKMMEKDSPLSPFPPEWYR